MKIRIIFFITFAIFFKLQIKNLSIFLNLDLTTILQLIQKFEIMESDLQTDGTCQTQVAGFIIKTYEILNNSQFQKIIFWSHNGKEFIIKDISKFEELVLPKYFRHKNLNSFIRQLNMYGFHKARKQNTKSVFNHPYFIRNREQLLPFIKRKIKLQQFNQDLTTPVKEKKVIDFTQMPTTSTKKVNQENSPTRPLSSTEELINTNMNITLKKLSVFDLEEDIFMNTPEREDCVSIQNQIQKSRNQFCRRLKGISLIATSVFLEQTKHYFE